MAIESTIEGAPAAWAASKEILGFGAIGMSERGAALRFWGTTVRLRVVGEERLGPLLISTARIRELAAYIFAIL